MRVLRDVVIDRTTPDELLAVSHLPGITGEEMSLDLLGGGASLQLKVIVLESRPVIVNGAVRHRLRLGMPGAAQQPGTSDSPAQGAGIAAAEAV